MSDLSTLIAWTRVVSGPSTHVYTARCANGETRAFRAWRIPGFVVADVRRFGRDGSADQNRLVFRPETLLQDGIAPDIVESARHSIPEGFALIREAQD